jgi:hypothetical protein
MVEAYAPIYHIEFVAFETQHTDKLNILFIPTPSPSPIDLLIRRHPPIRAIHRAPPNFSGSRWKRGIRKATWIWMSPLSRQDVDKIDMI